MKKILLFLITLCMAHTAEAQFSADVSNLNSKLGAGIAAAKAEAQKRQARQEEIQRQRDRQNQMRTFNAVRNVQQGRQHLEQNVHAKDFMSGNPDDFIQNQPSQRTWTATTAPKLERATVGMPKNGDMKLQPTAKGIRSWPLAEQPWNYNRSSGGNYREELGIGKQFVAKKFVKPGRTMARQKTLQKSAPARYQMSSQEIRQNYGGNKPQGMTHADVNTRKEQKPCIVMPPKPGKGNPTPDSQKPYTNRPIAAPRTGGKQPATQQPASTTPADTKKPATQQPPQQPTSGSQTVVPEISNGTGKINARVGDGYKTNEPFAGSNVKPYPDNANSAIMVSLGSNSNIASIGGASVKAPSKGKSQTEGLHIGFNANMNITEAPDSPNNRHLCAKMMNMHAFTAEDGSLMEGCYVEQRKTYKRKK